MAGIMTPKKNKTSDKKSKSKKMYILWNVSENWQTGPKFSSEKAAKDYVAKNGYMNTDYELFSCESILKTNTKHSPIWTAA